ncbi:MAG TPA: type II toxin-antitoxin system VapC family toxin [Caulobacter sp.]|nr:type II toxin-antitoxin system VapC family toxin [Caulobacter sp.]
MIVIADTHVLLWVAEAPERLLDAAQDLLTAEATTPLFSVVSLWEISIKRAQDRADFQIDPHRFRRQLLGNDWRELPISSEHAILAGSLPALHKDPFDRMLLAQAIVEGARLLTMDRQLKRYGAPVLSL